ncbi:uncharacterized protein LOC127285927 isoform X2 [Leptopilina boulardi]|uniref:uncharacterized protein LOC127285927 isoform X2 n=1 Tax=Leptopilina boulardi TaxID=63433 RepID=UPI0021F619DC|nr:uncharacterized protein LOC127285927 isoform X2 [Leptopilina boulardi]
MYQNKEFLFLIAINFVITITNVNAFDYENLPRDKKNCICAKENNYIPEFKCEDKCTEIIGRYNRRTCYIRISRDVCVNQVVCPKRRLRCLMDGVRRIEGETFFLKKHPLKECICQAPNSEGVKIFCFNHKNFCNTESLFIKMLIKKEAPFYFSDENPQTYCPAYSKIYTEGDEIIQPTKIISKHARNCTYGILSMPIGAKLKNYNSRRNEFSCAECECIIPPSLTCKALTRFECEKSFQNFKNNSKNLIPQKRLDKCVVINKDI